MFLTFLYQFLAWYLWLAFCYFCLSVPVQVPGPVSRRHLLLNSTYFKSYLNTTWNQQLIHRFRIRYIPISNIQHISVSVMWHKGTSVYISYCQLQQVTQPYIKPTISSYWLYVVSGHGITRKSLNGSRNTDENLEELTSLMTDMLAKYSSKWINGCLTDKWLTRWPTDWMSNGLNDWLWTGVCMKLLWISFPNFEKKTACSLLAVLVPFIWLELI